jgi:hypothetical protein
MGPKTRYAKSGDVSIAYQVVGDGPVDLVFVPGFVSHLELAWEEELFARPLRRMASFARLILFDKREQGTVGPGRPPAHPRGVDGRRTRGAGRSRVRTCRALRDL